MSLTSFGTILLDCNVTAVVPMCIKKKVSKWANFCAAILILKMEEDTQHFWCSVLYHLKKGKNATKTQKMRLVQSMEKVL